MNEVFAHRTMDAVREVHNARMEIPECTRPDPPIVWIHDYHLMLAANTIRSVESQYLRWDRKEKSFCLSYTT